MNESSAKNHPSELAVEIGSEIWSRHLFDGLRSQKECTDFIEAKLSEHESRQWKHSDNPPELSDAVDGQEFNVMFDDGKVGTSKFRKWIHFPKVKPEWDSLKKVIAWRPLPPPPKLTR